MTSRTLAGAVVAATEGPERLSNGDQITFSSDLLDAGSKDVGGLDVSCAVTRPGGFAGSRQQCTGTATLPGGTLTLARGGRVSGGTDAAGSIVGGSGAYAGATGEFTEAQERGGRTPYTFRLWLPADRGPLSPAAAQSPGSGVAARPSEALAVVAPHLHR